MKKTIVYDSFMCPMSYKLSILQQFVMKCGCQNHLLENLMKKENVVEEQCTYNVALSSFERSKK